MTDDDIRGVFYQTGKHATGPWTVEERPSYWGVFAGPVKGWFNKKRLIASCAKPHEDARTHAQLIATAPETLEALRSLVHSFEGYENIDEALHEARAAIAKAEGR